MKRKHKKDTKLEKKEKQILSNKTYHHIIPLSRLKGHKLVTPVDRKAHDLYHQQYSNMIPEEIIEYLVNKFWAGDNTYVWNYLDSLTS